MLSNPVQRHLPQIDVLRAVAVLAVMIFHLEPHWLPGGFTGVDVFFVISGYVVSASLAQNTPDKLSHFVARFYARRMLRILPALLVCMLCTVLLMAMFVPESWLSGANKETVLLGFAGLSNFSLMAASESYFSPRVEFNMATHTWSLAVEEQFYFVFPVLFFFWARKLGRASDGAQPWWRALGLPALIALSALLAAWASSKSPLFAYYSLPTRFWELGAGALLFRAHSQGQFLATRLRKLMPWLGVAGVLIGLLAADKTAFPMPWALFPVLGTLALMDSIVEKTASSPGTQLPKGPIWAALVWVGKASYSLYLWHWPVYTLFRWTTGLDGAVVRATAVLLVFVLAALSFGLVENPVRRSRRLLELPSWKVVTLGLAFTGVFAGLGLVGLTVAKPLLGLSVTENKRDWYAMDWYVDKPAKAGACRVLRRDLTLPEAQVIEFKSSDCKVNEKPKTLFVVGDSHAAAYSTDLSHLVKDEPELTVRVYLRAGCAFLSLMTPSGQSPSHCAAFAEAVKTEVRNRAAAGDVIFLPSLRLRRFADQFVVFDDAVAAEKMNGPAAQAARRGAIDEAEVWLGELAASGGEIVFEAPKPVFRAPPFRCSDWFNQANPICAAGLTMSRASLLAYRAPVMQGMEHLVQKVAHVSVWDPMPILCPDAECLVRREGRPMFFDADHLSGFGNDVLYPSLKRRLDSLWRNHA